MDNRTQFQHGFAPDDRWTSTLPRLFRRYFARPNRTPSRYECEANMLRAVSASRSGSAAQSLAHRYSALSAVELHAAARTARARFQGELIAAALRAVADSVCRRVEQTKRRRQARMIYLALSKLDARTLCDVGLRRCEIRSFAAEANGVVQAGRS